MSDSDSKPDNKSKGRVKAPRQIGKYELKRRLGAGGMGAVLLATDTKTKRAVALKVLPRDKAANETLVKRFQAEAQAAANLEHEHIVRVYEADQADGYLYIALEYIDGTDVDLILKKRERMPVKRAAEVIKQVAMALQHAHEQNIVHRDIKPSNIMIRNDGVAKLTDMGLARSVDDTDDTNITRAGTTVGTVDYMAPEQARNSRLADIRSDLYSLGCTWYQMVVGHPPYPEGSLTNKLQAHSSGKLPDPRDENPDVPESTVIMIHQLMAKKPEDRYQTPQELLDDFQNSSMHRSALSDDVFSALAEEESSLDLPRTGEADTKTETATYNESTSDADYDTSDSPDSESALRRKRQKKKQRNTESKPTQPSAKGSRTPQQPKLPPRQDRADAPDQQESRGSQGDSTIMDSLKYLLVAGGFIGVFVGIWYVLTAFASGLDPGGSTAVGESQRQTARDLLGDQQTAPIPTGRRQSEEEEPQPTKATFAGPDQKTPSRQNSAVSKLELIESPSIYKAPDWANQVPVSAEIPTLLADWKLKPRTVGQWGNQLGAYRTINTAFKNLPEGPVWIELLGPGPFSMNPVEFANRNIVISRASDEYEPSIVCLAGQSKPTAEFLKVRGGTLLLTGVNFVLDAHQLQPSGPASLISLSDGNLFLRDVSISVFGRREVPTHAISYSSSKSTPDNQRVLIDRSLIRGNCTSLRLGSIPETMLVTNSLLLSAEAPILSLDSPDSTQQSPAAKSSLNIVRSTLATSQSFLVVEGKRPKETSLQIALEATQCLSSAGSESPLVNLKQWAISPTARTDQSQADHFHWTTDASQFRGWKTLLSSGVNAVEPISDIAVWQKFWVDSFNNSENSSEKWSSPQAIDALGFNHNLWTDASSSGLPTKALSLPSPSIQLTTRAMSEISDVLPTVFQQPPTSTIELNLDKTNLDDELKKTTWKSGTRFLLSGTRAELLKPIVVDGRSLILEMAPNQPKEFELQPRTNITESLITVQNASLQLKNVQARIPNRSRESNQPKWLLEVINGSLLIEQSDLKGPYLENDQYQGLVHWDSGTGQSLPNHQPRGHLLEIDSSVLITKGVAVSTISQAGLVRVNNSLIAAQGTAWECQFSTVPESASTLFDFRQSTLGGSDSVLSVIGSPQDEAGIRGAFLVRDCLSINTYPNEIRRSKTTFLAADSAWLNSRNLIWWGRANGWSTDISCFTRAPSDVGEVQTIDQWTSLWGEFNVQKPLYNPGGVILVEQEKKSKELLPEYFQLDLKSRALKWNLEGDSIGANLEEFLPAQTAEDNSTKKTPSKARPTSGF